jgi:hypothetical protein
MTKFQGGAILGLGACDLEFGALHSPVTIFNISKTCYDNNEM